MLANIIRNAKKTAIGGGGGGIVIDNGDPFYSVVSLLLPMDGTNGSTTFTDSSLNGLTVTAVGNAQITSSSQYGTGAGSFDGTNSYIQVGTSNDSKFLFGTGDFTIEFWCYVNAFSGTSIQTPINNYGSSVTGWNIQLNCVNTNNVRFSYGDATLVMTASNTISPGQWNHVAVTRSGTTARIWINGVASATATNSTNISAASTLTIARGATGAAQYFNGKLDDLRISRFARYVSNFTPPTAALPTTASSTPADPYYGYTSLLLHMDGSSGSTNFVDSGPNALAVTRTGTPTISTSQSKYGGSSVALNGTTDRLNVASNALFAFGAGDFTVEFWLYFNSLSTAQVAFVDVNASGGFSCYWTASNYFAVPANSFVVSNRLVGQFQSSWIPSANTWYHVAISRNGTNLRVFINGTQLGSTVTSSTNYVQGPLEIGYLVNGYIDDLRITKYARYTSAFTPPAQAFPNA